MKSREKVEKFLNDLDKNFKSKELKIKMQEKSFGKKGYRYEQDKSEPNVFYKVYKDKNKKPESYIFNENDDLVEVKDEQR